MFKTDIFEKYKSVGLSKNEANAELNLIFDYLKIDPLKEIKNGLSSLEEENIMKIVDRRIKTLEPIQHIVGFSYFMGDRFKVNKDVLIPRPETELLVEECLTHISKDSKVLDIGTGSGCIAIEISKRSSCEVRAVDISEHALKVAKDNALSLGGKCDFFLSDLFSNVEGKFDLIVSNPPYIPINDIDTLSVTVKDFEPHAALFSDDEFGVNFYRKIINQSVTYLNNGGFLAFEIGINQADIIFKMLENKGFSNIKIIDDLSGIQRVTIAQYFV